MRCGRCCCWLRPTPQIAVLFVPWPIGGGSGRLELPRGGRAALSCYLLLLTSTGAWLGLFLSLPWRGCLRPCWWRCLLQAGRYLIAGAASPPGAPPGTSGLGHVWLAAQVERVCGPHARSCFAGRRQCQRYHLGISARQPARCSAWRSLARFVVIQLLLAIPAKPGAERKALPIQSLLLFLKDRVGH